MRLAKRVLRKIYRLVFAAPAQPDSTEEKVGYSQHSEQRYILRGTKTIKTGRFLDIGAWEPKRLSNTRALYELGWKGVMIEPSPWPFKLLLEEYGQDNDMHLICAAIGARRQMVEFHATDEAVSTWNDKWRERWIKEGIKYYRFFVQVITLEDVLKKFGKKYDFINIDVERNSANITLRLLELGLRPKCFCAEHDERAEEIEAAAKKYDYKTLFINGENIIMERK